MPYGELIPGMAYLVRRLLENTSNDSFLRAAKGEEADGDRLLQNPVPAGDEGDLDAATCVAETGATTARPGVAVITAIGAESKPTIDGADHSTTAAYWQRFRNEPLTDFAREANRAAMSHALTQVAEQFGREVPLVIGDRAIRTSGSIRSVNPADFSQTIGSSSAAEAEHAALAVAAAGEAAAEWVAAGVAARASALRRAAGIMRGRRFELAAWIVFEAGKGWRSADADVAEAIDFLEYYAAGAEDLLSERGMNVPGEENRFFYLPRGVAAVIAPWNFPLAILTGMTAAALATGNTVVMKPAEQSPVIAASLMEILQEAGVPPGVVNFLPGRGTAGAALVEHPDVDLIAFTGSREVGLEINAATAQQAVTGHRGIKKVIAEMGGKNAIIVDDDADLDEAVAGVVEERLRIPGPEVLGLQPGDRPAEVYDIFTRRLVDAARSLEIGPAVIQPSPGARDR